MQSINQRDNGHTGHRSTARNIFFSSLSFDRCNPCKSLCRMETLEKKTVLRLNPLANPLIHLVVDVYS